MRQIILDTETTGLRVEEGHRIIEIGCVEMVNRRLTHRHFHYYLNPDRQVDPGAFAVHGISDEFLAGKPRFSDIVSEFMTFIEGAELIIHNAPFDLAFLNNELMLLRQGYKTMADYCSVIDTLQMARTMHVGQRNSLDALCKRYGIDNSKRDLHGALLDAQILAAVYLAMTGGQESFFDGESSNTATVSKQSEDHYHQIETSDRLVIRANEDELKAHQAYLEFLQKKGQCVWLKE